VLPVNFNVQSERSMWACPLVAISIIAAPEPVAVEPASEVLAGQV
jgi:hypothetical protein